MNTMHIIKNTLFVFQLTCYVTFHEKKIFLLRRLLHPKPGGIIILWSTFVHEK